MPARKWGVDGSIFPRDVRFPLVDWAFLKSLDNLTKNLGFNNVIDAREKEGR